MPGEVMRTWSGKSGHKAQQGSGLALSPEWLCWAKLSLVGTQREQKCHLQCTCACTCAHLVCVRGQNETSSSQVWSLLRIRLDLVSAGPRASGCPHGEVQRLGSARGPSQLLLGTMGRGTPCGLLLRGC